MKYYVCAVLGAVIGWMLCCIFTVAKWSDHRDAE